jgi:alkaline phosphatase
VNGFRNRNLYRFWVIGWILLLAWMPAAKEPARRPAPVRVILMIGDGMGLSTVAHAHYYSFGADGDGSSRQLAMESLPVAGFAYTHASDRLVTDSAAAATALLSGCKTRCGYLGVDAHSRPVATLVEEAAAAGLSTGVLTTVPLTHATPAGCYAHVNDRKDYGGIFGWLLRTRPDLAVGWGGSLKSPYLPADYEEQIRRSGIFLCRTASAWGKLQSLPAIAIFDGDHLLEEGTPGADAVGPRLPDLTVRSLELLGRNPDGFFLMVEGGAIDWANHGQNLTDAVSATLEFDRSVDAVRRWIDAHGGWERTLLVVTADHETGELAVRNPGGGTSEDRTSADGPEWPLRAGTYAGYGYGSKDHSAVPVPVFAAGCGSERLSGVYDNTRIHDVLHSLLPAAKPTPKENTE